MPKVIHELLEAIVALLGSLVPAGLGAVVSMLYDMPATWAQRATQLWVGIVVSYFVQRAAGAVYPLHPFVIQALSFWIGMVAFKAAPAIVSGTVTVAGETPRMLRDRLLALLPSKEKK